MTTTNQPEFFPTIEIEDEQDRLEILHLAKTLIDGVLETPDETFGHVEMKPYGRVQGAEFVAGDSLNGTSLHVLRVNGQMYDFQMVKRRTDFETAGETEVTRQQVLVSPASITSGGTRQRFKNENPLTPVIEGEPFELEELKLALEVLHALRGTEPPVRQPKPASAGMLSRFFRRKTSDAA